MKPKKSLGQNFLKSFSALNKIIEAGEILPDDIILEIGPGKGALTEKILEKLKTGKLIAIEKDNELFEFLKIKFEKEIKNKKLILLNEDILNFKMQQSVLKGIKRDIPSEMFSDSPRKFSAENFLCPSPSLLPRVPLRTFRFPLNYKIIANIPYNITGAILKKFLTDKNQPERMVLMVQNEVAKRIIAIDGKESILSISVKAYGEPKMIIKVPARYFSPAPKVDSAVILIKNISRSVFVKNKIDEKLFWKIVHAGFTHKRKKLSSNLKKYLKINNPNSINLLENKRAEELSLGNWIELSKSTLFDPKK